MQKPQTLIALSVFWGLLFAVSVLLFAFSRQSIRGRPTPIAETNPPLGVPCAVEFRVPLPSNISSMDLKGRLKFANDKWLVLTNEDKPGQGDVWINRDSVLLVITGKAATTYKGLDSTY